MGVSSNHHFIPRAILRRFCFQGERLYYFSNSASQKGVQERSIDSVFKKRDLNSSYLKDGRKDDSLEEFFAVNVDSPIGEIISFLEFMADRNLEVVLSDQQRGTFVQFFYNHMKRTPDFHNPIIDEHLGDSFFENVAHDYEKKVGPLSNDGWDFVRNHEVRKRVVAQTRVKSLGRQDTKILDSLWRLRIVVARPQRDCKTFGDDILNKPASHGILIPYRPRCRIA